ncbi:MAG TPA: DUF86 domain-containing protein [Thermoanaerobaculia bacterium]|nr:DUF86 domain-containing protein [Thermoanaerobaculia bacterium]
MRPDEPPVERDVLRQKVQFVRDQVRLLDELASRPREDFLSDWTLQAAATRSLQIAIEAILDACHHVIAREGLGLPKTYQEAIDLVVRHGVLPKEAHDMFSRMVRFRNRAVHLYEEIDPEEIWQILQDHLDDFEVFVAAITRRYF